MRARSELLVPAVLAERQVAAVRFDGRRGRVPEELDLALLLLRRDVIVVAALVPRAEEPALRGGLAPGGGGVPAQRLERRRPGVDRVGQVTRLGLDAPPVAGVGPQAHVAEVILVDRQSVAPGRQHPRQREVRGVGPVADRPGRHGPHEERVFVRLIRSLADVVLDDATVQADRVRAFPEAEEPLAVGGPEALADDRGAVGADPDRDAVRTADRDLNLGGQAARVAGSSTAVYRSPLRSSWRA